MSHFGPKEPEIALVGYRGTGKTTVGRIVADRLARPFADADREVETLANQTIRSIFQNDGEPVFRDWEALALLNLTSRLVGGVIATGGGAILRESNRRVLRNFGLVVWLTAEADTLAIRIEASSHGVLDRPALTSAGTLAEIAGVLEVRTPLYREVAHVEVSTGGRNVSQVAEAVIEAWSRHQVERAQGVSR